MFPSDKTNVHHTMLSYGVPDQLDEWVAVNAPEVDHHPTLEDWGDYYELTFDPDTTPADAMIAWVYEPEID